MFKTSFILPLRRLLSFSHHCRRELELKLCSELEQQFEQFTQPEKTGKERRRAGRREKKKVKLTVISCFSIH